MSRFHLATATMSYRRAHPVTVLVPGEGPRLTTPYALVGYGRRPAFEEAARRSERARSEDSSLCRVPPKGGQP